MDWRSNPHFGAIRLIWVKRKAAAGQQYQLLSILPITRSPSPSGYDTPTSAGSSPLSPSALDVNLPRICLPTLLLSSGERVTSSSQLLLLYSKGATAREEVDGDRACFTLCPPSFSPCPPLLKHPNSLSDAQDEIEITARILLLRLRTSSLWRKVPPLAQHVLLPLVLQTD